MPPIFIAGILIDIYPAFRSSWNWGYWYLNVFISGGLYFAALVITPNLKKAKSAYLLRSAFYSFQGLFFIVLGQVVAFVMLPKNFLPWYFLFLVPVLIFAPILFRKKVRFLKAQIQSPTVKWKLKKNPVWDSQEYLPDEMDNTLFNRIGCFYSLFVILIAYFLLNIYSFFSVPVGDLIRFGIVNAFIILSFIEITYRYIIIYYLLTELEYEIFQPILLKTPEEKSHLIIFSLLLIEKQPPFPLSRILKPAIMDL